MNATQPTSWSLRVTFKNGLHLPIYLYYADLLYYLYYTVYLY